MKILPTLAVTTILAFIALVGLQRFTVPAAVASVVCTNVYTSATSPQNGFGAAYNLFTTAKEFLMQGTCPDSSPTTITMSLGSGGNNQFIYENAYYWNGSGWSTAPLTGGTKVGAWYIAGATTVVPKVAGGQTSVVSYMCQYIRGAWKCGCKDGACTTPYWQMQTITYQDSAPMPATGGTTSGGTNNPWVMGYYVGYQAVDFPPSEIDFSGMTHIAVGRVVPQAGGSLDADFDMKGDDGTAMAKEVSRLAHKKGVKTLLMVGGDDTEGVWASAATTSVRATFVKNLVALMDKLDYDGLDIDWEPITTADQATVLALVQELKKAAPNALITVPVIWVSNTKDRSAQFTWYASLASYVDRLFIMTYSMSGQWSGWSSWHSSALYGDTTATPSSIESSVNTYLKAGVPRAKLGFGVGFYARCWAPPVSAPGQVLPATYPGGSVSSMSDRTFYTDYYELSAYHWDSTAAVPYVSFSSPKGALGCGYVSFEDVNSVTKKVEYLKQQKLGGLIIWTLGSGYFPTLPSGKRQPLLDAVKNTR